MFIFLVKIKSMKSYLKIWDLPKDYLVSSRYELIESTEKFCKRWRLSHNIQDLCENLCDRNFLKECVDDLDSFFKMLIHEGIILKFFLEK